MTYLCMLTEETSPERSCTSCFHHLVLHVHIPVFVHFKPLSLLTSYREISLSATMENVHPTYLQYAWSGPAMRDTGQSHQMLHPLPPQHPYHAPFANQVAQYYHANHQSSYMMYPSSPHQKHIHPFTWNTVSPFPPLPTRDHLGCFSSPCPSSPPSLPSPPTNFIQYADHVSSSRQRPSPPTTGNHTANLTGHHHATSKKPFQSPTPG